MYSVICQLKRRFSRAVFRGLVPILSLNPAFSGSIELFGDLAFLEATTRGIRMLQKLDPHTVRHFEPERHISFKAGVLPQSLSKMRSSGFPTHWPCLDLVDAKTERFLVGWLFI
jgi:hypothetical protein